MAVPAHARHRNPVPEIAPADLTAYARARAADALGNADTAAAGYAVALADSPGDTTVALRAYREGLTAGDYALATRALGTLFKADTAPSDASVLAFSVALKARDWTGADAALARMKISQFGFMVPVLTAWLALDRHGDAVAALDPNVGSPLTRRFAALHHALLLLATHKTEAGLAELKPALEAEGGDGQDMRYDAALLLDMTGARDAAASLLADSPTQIAPLRNQASRARPGATFGAARLFLALAGDLAQQDAAPLSIVLTRAVLLLDSDEDRARLYLADALSRSGSDRLALDMLDQVRKNSPFARAAVAGRIAALRRAGRIDEAIACARQLSEGREGTSGDAAAYGDVLASNDQFDDAAAAYGLAASRAKGNAGWMLDFLRGTALDRAGRWTEALPALRQAAAGAPREPVVLTYLGRAEVEHRGDLDEAQKLLERAQRLSPDDAHVSDSLAWAYYLRGNVDRALPMLEKAARDDPGGSLVNEHLGDVYWQLGRRYEARYAWRAAAINADSSAGKRIQGKLAAGLTAAN